MTSAVADLITTLEVGLDAALGGDTVPVRPPGSSQGALPAVQVTLADWPQPLDGGVIEQRYEVQVLVPRDDAVARCELLDALTLQVLAVLLDRYGTVGTMRAVGGQAEDVHHIGRAITVAAAHRQVVC